jgi:hypothetical protein
MGVIENIREVADLVKKIGDLELNRKILNLEGEVHELKRSNMQLETELSDAQRLLRVRQEMTFREPFYYAQGDEVPHCPACWNAKDIAVHVVFVSNRDGEMHWRCPNCKHDYYDKRDRSEQRRVGSRGIGPYGGSPNGWMR